MKRLVVVLVLGLIALSLGGCSLLSAIFRSSPSPTPTPDRAPGFVTSRPDPPHLVAPENGAAVGGTNILFHWENLPDGGEYSLHVCKGVVWSDSGMIFSESVGNVNEVNIGGFPNDNSIYIWRVRAGNELGWSDLSGMYSFVSGSVPVGPMRLADHLLIRYKVVKHIRYQDGSTGTSTLEASVGSSFPDSGLFPTIIYDPATRTYTVNSQNNIPVSEMHLHITITLDETFENVSHFVAHVSHRGWHDATGGGIPFSTVETDWHGLGKYDVYRILGGGACSGLSSVSYTSQADSYEMTGYSCDASSYIEIGIKRHSSQ